MTYSWLVPLPVILPLVAAGLALAASGHPRVQRLVSTAALVSVFGVAVALVLLSDRRGPLVMFVGGWTASEGVVLVADRLASLMVLVSVGITLAVLAYSIGEGDDALTESDQRAPVPVFHPTLLVLSAGVPTTFLSGDLFHLYVGFEMLLFASFVLLTLGGAASRVRAAVTYVLVSLLSSAVFLVAIAMVYAATGTVNLALLAGRLATLPPGTSLMLNALLVVGFTVKAAVFPMSSWLPDSYPTAPAPVTAVFAGLLTKVGIYALIRTQTLLFPDSRLNGVLMVAALLTMVVGILGAVAQDDIKRMLSYTLVSHIGYLVFGISVGGATGLSSAIFYVCHHIVVQTTLFLVTGLVERVTGTTDLRRLGGLAAVSPLLAWLFFLPAINLAGIPPLPGFLGKLGLLQAGAVNGSPLAWTLVVGSVVTSLLTLYAVARVWQRAFWGEVPAAVGAWLGDDAAGSPQVPVVGAGLGNEVAAGGRKVSAGLGEVAGGGGPRVSAVGAGLGGDVDGRGRGVPAGGLVQITGGGASAADEAAPAPALIAGADGASATAVDGSHSVATVRPGGAVRTAGWGSVRVGFGDRPLRWGVVVPTVALATAMVGLAVLAGWFYPLTDRAAADLLDRATYLAAVLP